MIGRRAVLKAGLAGGIVLRFDLWGVARAASLPASLARNPRLDSWIRVGEDGAVTVMTGKVEIGQGIKTALVQIAADELDVAPERIALVTADTAETPDEGITAGSRSIQQSGMAIRHAAAEMRHILLERAAERLGISRAQLEVGNGVVSGGGKEVDYATLAAMAPLARAATGNIAPKPPADRKYAGAPHPRVDLPAKVFGEAAYLHDIRLPGMLHGRVVRPPAYDAAFDSVDESAATSMPGVVKVLQDGRFLGVVAEREEQAIAAAEALRAASTWRGDALKGAPARDADDLIGREGIAPQTISERAAPLNESPVKTISRRYFRRYQAHASMSPSIALAEWDSDGLHIWSHSQGVFFLRGALAQALDIAPEKIRVTHAEGAGCYGHNGADDVALDAALLARAVPGRPVRVQWMRDDEFRWEPYGSEMAIEFSGAVDRDGRIADWDFTVWGHAHTHRPMGRGGNLIAAQHLSRPLSPSPPFQIPRPTGGLDRNAVPIYDLPHHRVRKGFIGDTSLRVSALRALGAYANVFAIESFVDELAAAAGRDPVDFRLAHLTDERAKAVVRKAVGEADWGAELPAGIGRGIGFARYKNLAGYLAVVADVEVDEESGALSVLRAVAAVDCGEVINPDGLANQIEGGLIQSTSWTLFEEVAVEDGRIASKDWASYPILRFPDAPEVEVHVIARPEEPPLGSGEVAQGPMAAAVANAAYAAAGIRLYDIPFKPETVKAALAARGA